MQLHPAFQFTWDATAASHGTRDLVLLRWDESGAYSGAYVAEGQLSHSDGWACTMINALRAQRLAAAHAPFDAWLYASDVVRNFSWSAWSRVSDAAWADDAGHCAAPLFAPTGPAAGANCVFLLPTPYELQAPPPPPLPPERSKFRERLPVVFMRADYARYRQRAFALGARPEHASWLNVSVVGRGVERVAFSEFARYRYLLDVGGVSGTTWSALRAKLLSGSLVFKVELEWQDWWHAHLQPFRDYLPVSVDLSDLRERYAAAAIPTASVAASTAAAVCVRYRWAEAHPAAAERIARSGARVAADTSGPRAMRDAVASSLISAAEAARGTTDTARRAFGTPLRRFDDSCTSA